MENTYTVQLRQRGVLTLPNALRETYHLDENDVFTLVDLGGTFVLSPKIPILSKLVGSIEQKREARGITLESLIEGVHEERHLED